MADNRPNGDGPMQAPGALREAAALVEPALRAAVDSLADDRLRLIAGYQLGWWDVTGAPSNAGGKGVRGALALIAARAAGAEPTAALPAAVAVELVHNFSLLHDDVMDHDLERRHRPTGWAAFGAGPAILAGSAMLTLAVQHLSATAPRAVPGLLDALQRLIAGQSDDLLLEANPAADLDAVTAMSAGKTAALLACATRLGPLTARAPQRCLDPLEGYGFELGMAFQMIDDVLGIVGDPRTTGKSASSDLRSGKRSAPVVAALHADNCAGRRLRQLLAAGPPRTEDDVALAARLVEAAGGLDWTRQEAELHTKLALDHLYRTPLQPDAVEDLIAVGRYLIERDR